MSKNDLLTAKLLEVRNELTKFATNMQGFLKRSNKEMADLISPDERTWRRLIKGRKKEKVNGDVLLQILIGLNDLYTFAFRLKRMLDLIEKCYKDGLCLIAMPVEKEEVKKYPEEQRIFEPKKEK